MGEEGGDSMIVRAGSRLGLVATLLLVVVTVHASPTDAKQVVAKLDTEFQAAVKVNDA
jgi:hypothetical protein